MENMIVILTGAGISAESGIDTFRGSGGLWENHQIEDVATPEGFTRNPSLVQRFYNERRRDLQSGDVQPNAAHRALARLEQDWPGEVLLVTQNIDDLHERAESKNLIHLHGELLKARCTASETTYPWYRDINETDLCQCCSPASQLRPHVVWFGEMPLQLDEIYAALKVCALFISIGTSGNVYPAADFVREAKIYGAKTVDINLEATGHHFDERYIGPATKKVPEYVATLLGLVAKK